MGRFSIYEGTVGQGVKYPAPYFSAVFILKADGWITCSYQEVLEGLMKANWKFVTLEASARENENSREAYGSVNPLFAVK